MPTDAHHNDLIPPQPGDRADPTFLPYHESIVIVLDQTVAQIDRQGTSRLLNTLMTLVLMAGTTACPREHRQSLREALARIDRAVSDRAISTTQWSQTMSTATDLLDRQDQLDAPPPETTPTAGALAAGLSALMRDDEELESEGSLEELHTLLDAAPLSQEDLTDSDRRLLDAIDRLEEDSREE